MFSFKNNKLSDELIHFLSRLEILENEVIDYYLIQAATHGYTEIARHCILAGANIHVRYPNLASYPNKSPIEIARLKNHTEIMELLSEAAASNTHKTQHFNLPDSNAPYDVEDQKKINEGLRTYRKHEYGYNGKTTAETQVWVGIFKVIHDWEFKDDTIQQKNLLDTRNKLINLIGSKSERALDMLNASIGQNNLPLCKLCLDANAPINESSQYWSGTPLHNAASEGNLEIIALLISRYANIDSQKSEDKSTPLMVAAYENNNEVMRYLIEMGAKLTLVNTHGASALDIEARSIYQGIINLRWAKQFGQGAILTFERRKGTFFEDEAREKAQGIIDAKSTLTTSLENCQHVMREVLAARKSALTAWETSRHSQEGIRRLERLKVELQELLLSSAPQDAFDMAAYFEYVEFMQLCLSIGADINKFTDNGVTALILATQEKHHEVMKILLENGADSRLWTIEGSHETAIMLAVRNNDIAGIKILFNDKHGDMLMKQVNASGQNIVQIAQEFGHHHLTEHRFFMYRIEAELKHKMPVLLPVSHEGRVTRPVLLSRSVSPSHSSRSKTSFAPE